jgi:arsenate reductase (glutaredoxin)
MSQKKVIHLSTCKTCQDIIKDLQLGSEFEFQDVKKQKITEEELDYLVSLAGTYEVLFNRISRKYRELELNKKDLSEEDLKNLMLKEYTLIKRPIIIIGKEIFIGNSKKNIEAVKLKLKS